MKTKSLSLMTISDTDIPGLTENNVDISIAKHNITTIIRKKKKQRRVQ